MEQNSILDVINEKIDERMKNMFRLGNRPAEIELGQIAGAYINANSITRPLLSSVDKDSQEAWFMDRKIDISDIKAASIHRREPVCNQPLSASLVEGNDSIIHVHEIGCCPTIRLSDLHRKSFSPIKVIEGMAKALMSEEESNMLTSLDESCETIIATDNITLSLIEEQLSSDTECVVLSPHLYNNICCRNPGENLKTKLLNMQVDRQKNVARISFGGRSIPIHLTLRASDKVYILKNADECGLRANTGNPLVICEPEPKKMRASVIGVIEFGIMVKKGCCRIIETSESLV